MPGINRANPEIFKAFTKALLESKYKKACIFISHISVDEKIAINIGEYIMKNADFDIYLDVYDINLREAVEKSDAKKITGFIEKGINECTHILCLVSSDILQSWWVPYEIGFAKKGSKGIATLILKNTTSLPSYLTIETVLSGIKSLNDYLAGINSSAYVKTLSGGVSQQGLIPGYKTNPNHPLNDYLEWDK